MVSILINNDVFEPSKKIYSSWSETKFAPT